MTSRLLETKKWTVASSILIAMLACWASSSHHHHHPHFLGPCSTVDALDMSRSMPPHRKSPGHTTNGGKSFLSPQHGDATTAAGTSSTSLLSSASPSSRSSSTNARRYTQTAHPEETRTATKLGAAAVAEAEAIAIAIAAPQRPQQRPRPRPRIAPQTSNSNGSNLPHFAQRTTKTTATTKSTSLSLVRPPKAFSTTTTAKLKSAASAVVVSVHVSKLMVTATNSSSSSSSMPPPTQKTQQPKEPPQKGNANAKTVSRDQDRIHDAVAAAAAAARSSSASVAMPGSDPKKRHKTPSPPSPRRRVERPAVRSIKDTIAAAALPSLLSSIKLASKIITIAPLPVGQMSRREVPREALPGVAATPTPQPRRLQRLAKAKAKLKSKPRPAAESHEQPSSSLPPPLPPVTSSAKKTSITDASPSSPSSIKLASKIITIAPLPIGQMSSRKVPREALPGVAATPTPRSRSRLVVETPTKPTAPTPPKKSPTNGTPNRPKPALIPMPDFLQTTTTAQTTKEDTSTRTGPTVRNGIITIAPLPIGQFSSKVAFPKEALPGVAVTTTSTRPWKFPNTRSPLERASPPATATATITTGATLPGLLPGKAATSPSTMIRQHRSFTTSTSETKEAHPSPLTTTTTTTAEESQTRNRFSSPSQQKVARRQLDRRHPIHASYETFGYADELKSEGKGRERFSTKHLFGNRMIREPNHFLDTVTDYTIFRKTPSNSNGTPLLPTSNHHHNNNNNNAASYPVLPYYKLLGVDRDTSQDDLKANYRKLARLYHPDSKANFDRDTTEAFSKLNRAYEVLTDPILKKQYDAFGRRGIGTSAASDERKTGSKKTVADVDGTSMPPPEARKPRMRGYVLTNRGNSDDNAVSWKGSRRGSSPSYVVGELEGKRIDITQGDKSWFDTTMLNIETPPHKKRSILAREPRHCFYNVLNVEKRANYDEIMHAYETLCDKYGPEVKKLEEVKRAFEVLTDPHLRRQYDLYGFRGVKKIRAKGSSPKTDHVQENPITQKKTATSTFGAPVPSVNPHEVAGMDTGNRKMTMIESPIISVTLPPKKAPIITNVLALPGRAPERRSVILPNKGNQSASNALPPTSTASHEQSKRPPIPPGKVVTIPPLPIGLSSSSQRRREELPGVAKRFSAIRTQQSALQSTSTAVATPPARTKTAPPAKIVGITPCKIITIAPLPIGQTSSTDVPREELPGVAKYY